MTAPWRGGPERGMYFILGVFGIFAILMAVLHVLGVFGHAP